MKEKSKPLKISFSTQKGGVGKSTLTTLIASVLHYRLGYNVLIIDCDFPQHSLTNMRERDKKNIMQNGYHKKAAMKQFQTINKKAYPLNQQLWLFWNQVDGREKTALYDAYQKVIAELNLSLMQTKIRDSKRFRKETDGTENYIFRSTLLPAELQLMKATRMDLFIEEFLKITHL